MAEDLVTSLLNITRVGVILIRRIVEIVRDVDDFLMDDVAIGKEL